MTEKTKKLVERFEPLLSQYRILLAGFTVLTLLGGLLILSGGGSQDLSVAKQHPSNDAIGGLSSSQSGEALAGAKPGASYRASAPGRTGVSAAGAQASATGAPLTIGITHLNTDQALVFLTATGGNGELLQIGDVKRQAELVVDYINGHGGIAKRQVKPVYHEVNYTNANRGQRMCSAFTEDNHVAFMVVLSPQDPSIIQCAADRKVPLVLSGFDNAYVDQERFAGIEDYYYTTANFVADRRERAYVDGLVAQELLRRGSKVGLLTLDNPSIRRSVDRSLKPALAAHGIKLSAEAVFPDRIQSPWSNYVLQFQTEGIDRVLFSAGTESIGSILFMRAAENQRYRPLYGLTSDQFLGFVVQNVPKEQLHGALAVGWIPYMDLSANSGATPAVSPTNATCRQIMAKGGEPEGAVFGWGYCDGLFFLKAALDAAGQVSSAALAASVEAMGESYTSVWHYGSRFGPGRHDGANVMRPLAFDDDCACFKYTGPPSRLHY